jgi:hypothetical protein
LWLLPATAIWTSGACLTFKYSTVLVTPTLIVVTESITRTEEELSKGHLENSLNVPYMFITQQGKHLAAPSIDSVTKLTTTYGCRLAGRENNPLFLEQVASLFNKEEHVVVVCVFPFLIPIPVFIFQ